MIKKLLVVFCLLAGTSSCKKGKLLENEPPTTFLSVSKIELTGEDRLTSEVTLSWFGHDRDGIVVGYEISVDNNPWQFTTRQDSTFRFPNNTGTDTADVFFRVRAIDNEGAKDPDPASLTIPIKNTPPSVTIDRSFVFPDTQTVQVSIPWIATDPDGPENIDSVFIRFNNGPWFGLRKFANLCRIKPDNLTGSGLMTGTVRSSESVSPFYAIVNERTEINKINGIRLNDNNIVYVRVRDVAGAESNIDSTDAFYFRGKTHSMLAVDAHFDPIFSSEAYYYSILDSISKPFDVYDLLYAGGGTSSRFWSYNFAQIVSEYDEVFFFTVDSRFNGGALLLDVATQHFIEYLNRGGKIFITAEIPGFLSSSSPIINYTPIQALLTYSEVGITQTRISNGDSIVPYLTGYPKLYFNRSVLNNAGCFYTKSSGDSLYMANPRVSNPLSITYDPNWPKNVAARSKNSLGQTNVVFFSVDLNKFRGNNANMRLLFDKVFNDEFDW